MVEQQLYIVHLVSTDDERLFLTHACNHHLAEEALREDVESVGGFVEQQILGVCGQSDADVHLLLLTHRETAQIDLGRHLELTQTLFQQFVTETGIEGLDGFYITSKADGRQVVLFWHDEDFREYLGIALASVHAIDLHTSFLCTKQTRDEIEQCALSCSVLAKQSIHASVLKLKREILQHLCRRTVAECYIFNINHSF